MRTNLGAILQLQGRNPEAETAFRLAVEVQSKLAGEFPSIPKFRSDLAGMEFNLGRQVMLTDEADARRAIRAAAELYDSLATEFPADKRYAAEAQQCRRILAVLGPEKPAPQDGKR